MHSSTYITGAFVFKKSLSNVKNEKGVRELSCFPWLKDL